MAQGYYNGNGYNNGNYNNGYYNNRGNYNGGYYNPNYRYNNNNNRNYPPRYNNVNNQNYRTPNNNNKKNNQNGDHKKNSLTPFYIIIACLLLVATGITGLLFVPIDSGASIDRSDDDQGVVFDDNIGNNTSNTKDDKVIGNDTYGYLTVPNNYVKYNASKTENTLQYASKDRKYMITMTYVTGTNAYNFSKKCLENLKNNSPAETKLAQITIEGKEAYQLYAVTETDTTMLAIIIDGGGKTHFVSIEGPDGTNAVFGALETYRFE